SGKAHHKKSRSEDEKLTLKKVDQQTIKMLTTTVSDLADDAGWAFLGEVGNLILKKRPDFDPRNFGFYKLAQMIRSIDKFEIDQRDTERKGIKLIYVRVKQS
ncbi:MAG: hypothetical protein RL220_1781, partial [Bacteroidota bacterium]